MGKTMNVKEMNAFIARPGDHYIWAAYTDADSAWADLFDVRKRQNDNAYIVMTDFDAFFDAAEAKFMTGPRLITQAEYWEALECLPPMQWHSEGGIERFCISEFTFNRITNQYAQMGDRYLTKPVKFNDRSTYITGADFEAAKAAETA